MKQRYLIESNMSATAPLPSPPIQRWHLDRLADRPSPDHRITKKKRKKKNSATMCLHSGKDNGIKTWTQGTRRNSLKKSIVRVRGSAAKMAAPHQAIPRRGWWHTHRWPRFCRFSVPFFFFLSGATSLSLAPLQHSLTDSLSHGKGSLYSLVVGRLG